MHLIPPLLWGALLLVAHSLALAGDFDLDLEQLNELSPRPGSVVNADNLAVYAA